MTAHAVPHAPVLSEDDRAIARAFVEARRSGRALPTYPGTPPATLEAAYAIQDAAIALEDATNDPTADSQAVRELIEALQARFEAFTRIEQEFYQKLQ